MAEHATDGGLACHPDVFTDLLAGRLPRHRGWGIAPLAGEYPDDEGGSGGSSDVYRSTGIPSVADGTVPHGEPAVVDGLHRAAAFTRRNAEMADGFAGGDGQPGV